MPLMKYGSKEPKIADPILPWHTGSHAFFIVWSRSSAGRI